MALLLLGACRASDARAGNGQGGVVTNFLDLQQKKFIMKRTGTIIPGTGKRRSIWAKQLNG